MNPIHVGVIGCGAISNQYLTNAIKYPCIRIAALSDLDLERAKAQATKYGIARACSVEDVINDPSIQITLNLTIPAAHVEVGMKSLAAGKHTFCEKPLGVDREEGRKLVEFAKAKRLRVGCAPDTILGAGIQTARKLIDDGAIGRPVAATAFMYSRGHEHWHPNPEFYYASGGGPMFDMGPYYLTALLQLLGPMKRVTGFASIAVADRTITSQPLAGKKIRVTTPDHVSGAIEFASGAVGTIVQSFATRAATHDGRHPIQVFGTQGTIKVPDPNGFDGPVQLCTFSSDGKDEYKDVPHTHVTGYGRAIGLADLASAIQHGRPHRCSMEQAFSVLDAMQGFLDASESGKAVDIAPGYERTAAMNPALPFGVLD